jgi:hypothetical protein
MAATKGLTKRDIENVKVQERGEVWLTDGSPERGGGRLVLRCRGNGSKNFYFRYFINGQTRAIPMGPYSCDRGREGLTLEAARAKAREYSALYRAQETRDVREVVQIASGRVTVAHDGSTLLDLCLLYCDHLELMQKAQTAKQARGLVRNWIASTPQAKLPARSVAMDDVTRLIHNIVKEGLRQKPEGFHRVPTHVRSIIHAAYGVAIRARSDAKISPRFYSFGIKANPVAGTATLQDDSVPRMRCLSSVELGHFWRHVNFGARVESPSYRIVRLIILLAGQRTTQVLRCLRKDVDIERRVITLYDPKGRRRVARIHPLPMSDAVMCDVQWWIAISNALQSPFLFPGTSSAKHQNPVTCSHLVTHLSRRMLKEQLCDKPFTLQDLRRTSETRLAELGINKDVRAQLLSHGIGGVQDRHYDRYDYMKEKTEALMVWQAYLSTLLKPA